MWPGQSDESVEVLNSFVLFDISMKFLLVDVDVIIELSLEYLLYDDF
jgi:hypothetical protein